MNLFDVLSVEEAKKAIDDYFKFYPKSEKVNILDSMGRIIYQDIVSEMDVPHFRRSTVDGYAVNSKDIRGASESIPAIMEYKGEVLMGREPSSSIEFPGECIYVPTGGMIPDGADSVVMVEYSEKLDENTILINKSIPHGENLVEIGEDIEVGEVIIKRGRKLRPYEIGVLSSLGIMDIQVSKRPKVAIISTGDEIVNPKEEPSLGEVRDINSYLIESSIVEDGGIPINYGVVKDDIEDLKDTVDDAICKADIVLISGGSSVGKKDMTIDVINSLGKPGVFVHGISIKPGKPTIIGKVKDKIVFGLPGHPLSAAIVYKIMVNYCINKLLGFEERDYPIVCKFSTNYHSAKGREEYLPVILSQDLDNIIATPIFSKSGLISGFSKADGIMKIDKNLEGVVEGEKVLVYKF